ncbi:hypothetical protein GC089_02890 [Cellulomonas sp. JZ18]|uniref:hypothetical protein n=1 Tax=Cellulomonas sp. JZ18 TaxID=2654191 RepID=UPI0012D3CCAB|nr:hypothetical protein [Cellulomonas sp. JZ18]QGQ18393.1 hypothetical protein GC089_02890 [Cellulomonas sp. JZ18]
MRSAGRRRTAGAPVVLVARAGSSAIPARVAVALVAGLALGACSTPSSGVPDDVLVEQIAGLPGVTSVTLEFQRDPTYGPHYEGEIVVDPGLTEEEARCVSAQAWEILWQGRRTQTSSVSFVHGDDRIGSFGDGDGTDYYGPRPAGPRATATITPCRPS